MLPADEPAPLEKPPLVSPAAQAVHSPITNNSNGINPSKSHRLRNSRLLVVVHLSPSIFATVGARRVAQGTKHG